MQEARAPQGDAVQDGQGLSVRAGCVSSHRDICSANGRVATFTSPNDGRVGEGPRASGDPSARLDEGSAPRPSRRDRARSRGPRVAAFPTARTRRVSSSGFLGLSAAPFALAHPAPPFSSSPSRQASLRPQTEWFRRPDQARVPQEGEDHQEDRAPPAVQHLQGCVHAPHQAVQDVRDWRRHEEQGRPLPVSSASSGPRWVRGILRGLSGCASTARVRPTRLFL